MSAWYFAQQVEYRIARAISSCCDHFHIAFNKQNTKVKFYLSEEEIEFIFPKNPQEAIKTIEEYVSNYTFNKMLIDPFLFQDGKLFDIRNGRTLTQKTISCDFPARELWVSNKTDILRKMFVSKNILARYYYFLAKDLLGHGVIYELGKEKPIYSFKSNIYGRLWDNAFFEKIGEKFKLIVLYPEEVKIIDEVLTFDRIEDTLFCFRDENGEKK